MAITERERNRLFQWFEEHMGTDSANSIMSLLPPVGWADVATTRDLDSLRLWASAQFADTRTEFISELGELRNDVHRDISALRGEVHRDISTLRDEMNTKFDKLDARFALVDATARARHDAIDARFAHLETTAQARHDTIDARFAAADTSHLALRESIDDLRSSVIVWFLSGFGVIVALLGISMAVGR